MIFKIGQKAVVGRTFSAALKQGTQVTIIGGRYRPASNPYYQVKIGNRGTYYILEKDLDNLCPRKLNLSKDKK